MSKDLLGDIGVAAFFVGLVIYLIAQIIYGLCTTFPRFEEWLDKKMGG